MKFVTKLLSFVFLLLVFTSHNVNSNSYENILRDAAKKMALKILIHFTLIKIRN